jgi:hypothetical protein
MTWNGHSAKSRSGRRSFVGLFGCDLSLPTPQHVFRQYFTIALA